MPDQGLRARVIRLLRGEFRADDLTRLFLYARDRCDGRESVQEVGDFVAHHDERNKGIVTRTVRDWFAITTFKMPNGLRQDLSWNLLPSNFPSFLSAMSRRLSHTVIKRDAGLSGAEAAKMISVINKKFAMNADGTLTVTNKHTPKEMKVMECFMNYIPVLTAFTGDRLFDDFAGTLRSHALLEKSELRKFAELKPAVMLFAITVMHRCLVVLDDGAITQLEASPSASGISVNALVPVVNHGQPNEVRVASPIFTADLETEQYCDPSLLSNAHSWDFELEVTADVRLGRLA
jgi:hypothetical protein